MVDHDLRDVQRRLEAAEQALSELRREQAELRREPAGRRRRPGGRALVAALALAVLAAPFAVAATGDPLREGVRNGTTRAETEIIGRFNATTGAKGGYVTRQSNIQTGSRAGGGAIYGCRGAAGGTGAGSAPCLRASNLANGLAFEFASRSGPTGLFDVGSPSDPPFLTNGTGRVANLNADKVDGLDAAQLQGQQGPPGPPGPPGPQGPPGPTASASDAVFTPNVTLDSTEAAVLTATITITQESRLVANATATLAGDSGAAGAADDVAACRLADSAGLYAPGLLSVSIPPHVIPRANIAVTGAAVRPAGTYAVSLRCRRQAGSAAVFDEGALTVVAAAV